MLAGSAADAAGVNSARPLSGVRVIVAPSIGADEAAETTRPRIEGPAVWAIARAGDTI
jgi:hypothetical protein